MFMMQAKLLAKYVILFEIKFAFQLQKTKKITLQLFNIIRYINILYYSIPNSLPN